MGADSSPVVSHGREEKRERDARGGRWESVSSGGTQKEVDRAF